MVNPVQPIDEETSYIEIGKAVKAVADKTSHSADTLSDAETEIVRNLTRPSNPGAPQIKHVSFVEEVSYHDKIVVVPDLSMIKAGAAQAENFRYTKIYRDHAAKQIVTELKDSGVAEADWAAELKKMAEAAIDPEDFHLYRLGEYCINQCM